MQRRTYAGLVTSKPPKEVAGKDNTIASVLQELSSSNPQLFVPQDDNALADRARALLLYDAALTPPGMPGSYGLPAFALDAARIVRAEQFARDNGSLPKHELTSEEAVAANKLVYSGRGGEQHAFANAARINALIGKPLYSVPRKYEERLESWDDVLALAEYIAKKAEREPKEPPPPQGGSGKGDEKQPGNAPQPDADDYFEPRNDELDKPESAEINASEYSQDAWFQGKEPTHKSEHKNDNYGKLENPSKPDVLPMQNFRRKGTSRKRPEMEGVVPSNMHRLFLDGKIFKGAAVRHGPRGRGTILVDMSGSMSWTYEDFKQMLEILPECSVYGYGGDCYHTTRGRLVLLADRGRCATMDAVETWKMPRGLNIVDGPALQFLARMTAPRIWISDGAVTGMHEHRSPRLVEIARNICEAARITRVRYASEAVKLMK